MSSPEACSHRSSHSSRSSFPLFISLSRLRRVLLCLRLVFAQPRSECTKYYIGGPLFFFLMFYFYGRGRQSVSHHSFTPHLLGDQAVRAEEHAETAVTVRQPLSAHGPQSGALRTYGDGDER